MKLSVYCGLLFGAWAVSSPAWAVSSLEQDVAALKEDVMVLQRQLYRAGNGNVPAAVETPVAETPSAPSLDGDARLKIGEYDESIRKLTGRVDTLEYQVKQLNMKIDKFNRDMDIRFKILEGRQVSDNLSAPVSKMPTTYAAPVAAGASRVVTGDSIQGDDLAPIAGSNVATDERTEPVVQTPELPKVEDGPQSLIPGEPVDEAVAAPKPAGVEEMYASGMQALNNSYYDEAELAFEHILKEYPKDKLAGNAQYWLGEVYYKKGDYNKAKLAFKNGYEKYKDGNKAADSLFKLGMTFKSLNETKNACIIFNSFAGEFPKANAELTNRVKSEASRLKCQ